LSAKTLKDMGLPKVSHIESGFRGWRDAGFPVVDYDEWKAASKAAGGKAAGGKDTTTPGST
jgi:3-mercaptopyruvate sulfurtransferase SseA